MQKRWNKAETDYLKRHADRSLEELADHFRTDPAAVQRQLDNFKAGQTKSSKSEPDAALKAYGQGLELLHGKQWKKAAALFENVIDEADSSHLADRARQNLAVCRQRLRDDETLEDPYLQAVFEKNHGNLDGALELCKEHGKLDKEERYAYLAASIRALADDEKEALKHLQTAIRLEPKNRVHAFHDPDFKALHDGEEFRNLTSESPS
jgi:tetratricopeptide (TPR) repeat protein